MSKIIGIDLGTTNSCVAVMEGRECVIIENGLGSRILKSVVRVLANGETIVGENAYRSRILDPKHTISGIKRFIGRRYNEVFDIAKTVPYNVILGDNNLAVISAYENEFTPQYISGLILKSLKSAAEEYLGHEVNEAVITIPAYFNEIQRKATKEAGEIAGFKVMRIINEPTAAALAYGLNKTADDKIVIFDLGGGTFDVSILEYGNGVFEVKSISGDGFLGGDDFDSAIVNWLLEEFNLQYGIDLSKDQTITELFREAAIKAKCELSVVNETTIEIPFIKNKNFKINITRAKFEEMCEDLFERLIEPCENALKESGYVPNEIDKIILVGGATRMPKITQIVEKVFLKLPLKGINPDEAVAIGAAIQGAVITGEINDVLLLDVTSKSFGVETAEGISAIIIKANTTIPTRRTEIFSTVIDHQTSVELNILEGEDNIAVNNKSIGRLTLEDIQPTIRGVPQIEVTFDIDHNSLLQVSVKDKGTGKEKKIRIEGTSGLTNAELLKRIKTVRHA